MTRIRIEVFNLKKLQDGPPMIWEAHRADGVAVYFRYRFGQWVVYTGDVSILSANRQILAEGDSGKGKYDGHCSFSEFCDWARAAGVDIWPGLTAGTP